MTTIKIPLSNASIDGDEKTIELPLEDMNVEREPRKCGNSTCVGGIYICRIMCIPCVRAKKCALETVKDMAGEMKQAMQKGNGHDDKNETARA